jgi:hypothetical protein
LLWSSYKYCFDFQEDDECVQSDNGEPFGRGISILRRKEISPGVPSKLNLGNVEQVEKWSNSSSFEASHEREIKASPMLGLLDLLDHHSDHGSKSMTELNNTTCKSPSYEKNSSFTGYIPAGANVDTRHKKSKSQRGMKSTSLIKKGRPSVDIRSDPHSLSFKGTEKCNSVSDILPQSASVSLDTERNEVQSSVTVHPEHSEQIDVKKQQRPFSVLEYLQGKTNGVTKNSNCRTENCSGMQCAIMEKDTASFSTRSSIQDVVYSIEKTIQSERQDLLDDLNKNSQTSSSIPDMTVRLPQAALKAVLKRETSGKCTQIESVNSLAR